MKTFSDLEGDTSAPADRSTRGLDLGSSRKREVGSVASPVKPSPPAERRNTQRRPASLVPSITGVRLSPHGVEATLVNISSTGVLLECGSRLQPGSVVILIFAGGFTPSSIESRIVRSLVAGIDKSGALRYQLGIAFSKPITLEDAPPIAACEVTPQPKPAPASSAPRNRW